MTISKPSSIPLRSESRLHPEALCSKPSAGPLRAAKLSDATQTDRCCIDVVLSLCSVPVLSLPFLRLFLLATQMLSASDDVSSELTDLITAAVEAEAESDPSFNVNGPGWGRRWGWGGFGWGRPWSVQKRKQQQQQAH